MLRGTLTQILHDFLYNSPCTLRHTDNVIAETHMGFIFDSLAQTMTQQDAVAWPLMPTKHGFIL